MAEFSGLAVLWTIHATTIGYFTENYDNDE